MFRIEKKTKIRQLTAVVKGLRIYNWDCGRGGIGESKIVTLTINDAKIGYLIFVKLHLIQVLITFQASSTRLRMQQIQT